MKVAGRGQKGVTVVAVIVYLALAAGAYLAWLYVPMFLRKYNIREALEKIANMSYTQRDDNYLRSKCVELMKEKAGLVIQTNDCRIVRNRVKNTTTVSYTYNETVHFVPTDHKKFYTFEMSFEQDMTAYKW